MRGYSSHPFPAEPDASACLAHWRSLTGTANAAFARADHTAARLAYYNVVNWPEVARRHAQATA